MLHGGDIYSIYENDPSSLDTLADFSANISPLGLPASVHHAVLAQLGSALHYPDPMMRRLKRAIQGFLAHVYGVAADKSWICCGNGAADVIYRFVLAKRPERALLCAPTFAEYEEALSLTNTKLEFYLCPKESLAVCEDILERIHPGLDVMFLCNPNNPTGLVIQRGLLEKIVQRTRKNGVFLVVDECFLDFLDEELSLSLIPLLSQNEHILVLKSFTKMYAMPGLRLGYGLCRDACLIKEMESCGQPWAVSTVAESAGIAALSDLDYPVRVRQYVDRERKFLMDAFSELGIHFFRSHANYILMQIPQVPDFYEQMLAGGILVRRCANYRNLDKSYYRVAVNSHENNVRLIETLQKVLKRI